MSTRGYNNLQSTPHRVSRGITSSSAHPVSKKDTQFGKPQTQKCAPISTGAAVTKASMSQNAAVGSKALGGVTTQQRPPPHLGLGLVVPNAPLRT